MGDTTTAWSSPESGTYRDAEFAARFAGWMLAEGRAEVAFTALEVAAAARSTAATRLPDAPPVVPTRTEVAAAIRAIGAVALIYLHPTDCSARTVGVLSLDPATDRLDVVANVPVTDPLECDDPSWPAIVERWLECDDTGAEPARVLVAATGGLAEILLPAVRTGSGRRLAEELVVSQVASGAEVVRLARRSAKLAGTTALELIHTDGLDMATIHALKAGTTAGVVILPRLDHGGFAVMADVLLEAGFVGVIGWIRPIDPPVAALALYMVHMRLADGRLTPASAVSSVQRWMLDPERIVPLDLPAVHANTVETIDLTRPQFWAALTYRGR